MLCSVPTQKRKKKVKKGKKDGKLTIIASINFSLSSGRFSTNLCPSWHAKPVIIASGLTTCKVKGIVSLLKFNLHRMLALKSNSSVGGTFQSSFKQSLIIFRVLYPFMLLAPQIWLFSHELLQLSETKNKNKQAGWESWCVGQSYRQESSRLSCGLPRAPHLAQPVIVQTRQAAVAGAPTGGLQLFPHWGCGKSFRVVGYLMLAYHVISNAGKNDAKKELRSRTTERSMKWSNFLMWRIRGAIF